jgi:glycine oxidase
MSAPDVIVAGGGVIGSAVAYFLAREGASVRLLERDDLAAHASGAAAGMLAPICESEGEGPFFKYALRSLELFPALAEELIETSGIDPQFVRSGVLRIALTESDAAALRRHVAPLARFDVEWLDRQAVLERQPLCSPSVLGGLWSPREGHVFSPQVTRAYAMAAQRHGATIETGVPITGLVQDGDRVTGVQTAAGPLSAGHVVLCTGAWTRFCSDWIGRPLPVRPVRGQILALSSPEPPLREIVWSEDCYLVPKLNGELIVGATEEEAGFDCRNTAAGVAELLRHAAAAIPALADTTFLRAWAGLRPALPDALPAIGPLPGIEGLTVAAGHYRNGVLLSPITGELVAGWVLRGEYPESARAFLPERFLGSSIATG